MLISSDMKSEREIIVKTVELLLGETGLSSSGLAKKSGIAASTLNRFLYRDPNYILSQKTLNALCKSAGYESYEGFAAMRFANDHVKKIPISAYVGHGGEVHLYHDGDKGPDATEIECPPGLDPRRVIAIRVKEDSMLPMFHPNWIVYYSEGRDIKIPPLREGWQVSYNERADDRLSEFFNKPCIVKLADGRTMLRILKPGQKPRRYTLASYNSSDIADVEIEWAAKIIFIKTV